MADLADVQAIVLAAGEGDRLGGIYPKPYTPVNGIPVTSRLLKQLDGIPTTLVVREQDEKMAEWIWQCSGRDRQTTAMQQPMSPAERILSLLGNHLERNTVIVLGDNVYAPALMPTIEAMLLQTASYARVAVQPFLHQIGLEHEDGMVAGRRWRRPQHDIGIYTIPTGTTLAPIAKKDHSVLGLLIENIGVRIYPVDLDWFDIGTPADLARADLFLRGKEGPCES